MNFQGPSNEASRIILDAIPLPVLVVDEDVRILDANSAGIQMLGGESELVLRQRSGEALHCVHSFESAQGCGYGEQCKDCVIRNSVHSSLHGRRMVRQKLTLQLANATKSRAVEMLITTSPLQLRDQRLVLVILEDITELTALRSLLPICAKCKKIRDDRQYWHQLEGYMSVHHHVDFSHGLLSGLRSRISREFGASGSGSPISAHRSTAFDFIGECPPRAPNNSCRNGGTQIQSWEGQTPSSPEIPEGSALGT